MKKTLTVLGLVKNSFFIALILICFCLNAKSGIIYHLKGKITEGTAKYIYFSHSNFWHFLPMKFDSIQIKKDGSFSGSINLNNSPIFLYNGAKNLGLLFPKNIPNGKDSIVLSINLVKGLFEVEDNNKPLYAFFYNYQNRFRSNGGFDDSYKYALTLNSKDFIQIISREYLQRNRILDSFELKNPLASIFVSYVKKTNYYEYYSKGYDYLTNHYYFYNKSLDYYAQDSLFAKFFLGFNLDSNDVNIPEFGYIVKYIIDNAFDSTLAVNKIDGQQLSSSSFKFNYAKSRFKNSSKVRDLALTFVIKDLVNKGATLKDFRKADSLVSVLESISNNELYKEFARNYYRKKVPLTSNIDFKLDDDKGKPLVLSSIKDKVVVIFFWATWCGPCKGQLKDYKLLTEQYGNEVQFLDVALEKNNKYQWKKFVAENFSGTGTHLYAEGGYYSTDLAQFNLNSIPRVVILKNQEVLNFNAPMPTDDFRTELIKYK